MQTINATELARNTREVLDKVVTGGEVVAIERNHALIAQIGPADRTMTAAQALSGLPLPILTATQAAAWLEDSRQGFDDAVPNPWA
jgi:antitoxin (DNA-binding transcriptional repressor) of toxin-antitoxin stability system